MSISNGQVPFSIPYDHRLFSLKLSHYLHTIVPYRPDISYVIACIGTDRSTGDSLGPFTGSLLQQRDLQQLHVYGTLHQPLHALNLHDYIEEINTTHKNAFIIAVDASLGKTSSIGTINCHQSPLKPGAALNKNLPEIGDIHLSATVNFNSEMNYVTLQNTRLSIVYDMASALAESLYRFDLLLRDLSRTSMLV